MSNKSMVQIASRTLSLHFVVWAAATLTNLLPESFSFFHYLTAPNRTDGQQYFYNYYLILIGSRFVLSAGLFTASVWIYRCGPQVYKYLAPTED